MLAGVVEQRSVSAVGSFRMEGGGGASVGLARITIDETSVRVGASHRLLRWFVTPWTCTLTELSDVQPIGRNASSVFYGIRFTRRSPAAPEQGWHELSPDWITFRTTRRAELVDFLRLHGVHVQEPVEHQFLYRGGAG
jgi:hypothetical protein